MGAIIGVIGLISGYAVLSARSHTRDVTRLANVREIQMSVDMYFQNHSAYPSAEVPIALGQALTSCLSQEGFSGPCSVSGPTPYLSLVTVPPAAGLKEKVSCNDVNDVYCYSGSEDAFRIEFELESGNALLGVAKGVNCLSENGFSAGACSAI
jgi:hypothetical protein